jgi:hypothetical protein
LNDLESDVAINGLHDSFLKGELKLHIIEFTCFSKKLNGANSLPTTEIGFIIFLRRRIQKPISGNSFFTPTHALSHTTMY